MFIYCLLILNLIFQADLTDETILCSLIEVSIYHRTNGPPMSINSYAYVRVLIVLLTLDYIIFLDMMVGDINEMFFSV